MIVTLANIGEATKQQIFDQVSTHLLKQNQKCLTPVDDQCVYRGGKDGDLKCAAGCLIGDDEYKPEMDRAGYIDNLSYGSNWSSLVKRGLVPVHTHINFINELQNIHDSIEPEYWKRNLNNIAAQNGLVGIAD